MLLAQTLIYHANPHCARTYTLCFADTDKCTERNFQGGPPALKYLLCSVPLALQSFNWQYLCEFLLAFLLTPHTQTCLKHFIIYLCQVALFRCLALADLVSFQPVCSVPLPFSLNGKSFSHFFLSFILIQTFLLVHPRSSLPHH